MILNYCRKTPKFLIFIQIAINYLAIFIGIFIRNIDTICIKTPEKTIRIIKKNLPTIKILTNLWDSLSIIHVIFNNILPNTSHRNNSSRITPIKENFKRNSFLHSITQSNIKTIRITS